MTMIWGGLPYYADDVARIISDTSSTFLKTNENTQIDYINQRITILQNLRDTLRNSEEAFYNALNLKGASSKDKIKELQERVEEINSCNRRFSVDIFVQNFLKDPEIITSLDKITTNAVNNALSSIKWTISDIAGTNEQEWISSIVRLFSSLIGVQRASGSYSRNYFTDIENQGLQRILTVERVIDSNNEEFFKISFKENTRVSTELRQKITEVIRRYTHTHIAETQSAFQNIVTKKILEYVQGSSSLMANCIRHEIMVNLDRYDLTRSLSSLKGFLQEVWSNAMLSFLFGRPGSSTPTGNIRNLIDNKAEIPVDAVLKNFNFQIKSFNLINGKYEIKETDKEIGTFLINRAQLDNSELLLLFFGSFQFNQPFKDAQLQTKRMTIDDYRDNIYSKFQSVIEQLEPVFQANVDKIVRIDNVFKGDKGYIFGKEKLYFNTFFIVNQHFVPASAMVDAIIRELNLINAKEILKFHLNAISTKENPDGTTLESVIKEGGRAKRYSGSILKVANLVKISYTINFDFDQIINNAYNWVA